MKLKSFRIKNYKSILDSRECRLSDNDHITVLAGQNESGKSSILQALRDFENEVITFDSIREDDAFPEINCIYTILKDDIKIEDIFYEDIYPESFKKIINNLKELNVQKIFDKNLNCTTTINEDLRQIFTTALKTENEKIISRNDKIVKGEISNETTSELWDIDETINEITNELILYTPKIIFFDDFCDILPDQILLKDLKENKLETKGYQAVKNIETILDTDLTKLDDLSDGRRETKQSKYYDTITAKFNEKWKQRISEGDGAKIHIKYNQGKSKDASYINFFIETKKGEYLTPAQRSQGFKWFLSFFLHLKAESERTKELIILFDEPGLFLHSKAQSDMIAVFEELALSNQIIYSTHSPYLINTSKIHRVKLILNTKVNGTTIEKITTNKVENQKDALKPIIDAIGLEVVTPFSVGHINNVILEGISDFHYFNAMKKLLCKEYEIGLLPSMGSSNVHLLMELCIGWGLNWLVFFDDKGATKDYNKIKKHFFNDSEADIKLKVFKIKDCDGIEDVFLAGDMKLVNPEAKFSTKLKNSEVVSDYGGKELYSRLFYEKVLSGEITKKKLSSSALAKFEEFFTFIEKSFGIYIN